MYYDDRIYKLSANLVDIGSEIWILELKTNYLESGDPKWIFQKKTQGNFVMIPRHLFKL